MDLSTLDTAVTAEAGELMTLYNPIDGSPILQEEGPKKGQPVTITLAGVDSQRYNKAVNANTNKRLAMRGRRTQTIKAEEIDAETLEVFVACTIGWDGIMVDGQLIPCEPQHVRQVYKRFAWVREQVDAFINDRSNFLRASSMTSSTSSRPNAHDREVTTTGPIPSSLIS